MNNIYIVYSESTKDRYTNGQTVQCDTLQELIFELQRCASEKIKNVVINTIPNGKPQS
ncbi:MAG TPA: hypothetical protein VIY47_01440 [Ignavibacteriaceae bacterium]